MRRLRTHSRTCRIDASHIDTANCHGGKATCKDKAICDECKTVYGELDSKNHTNLKHFPAKNATETADGNIEYWYCDGCGRYYKDAEATQEIKKADTIIAAKKIKKDDTVKEEQKGETKAPKTGDDSSIVLWTVLIAICGGALIGMLVIRRKKNRK